ncbi:MAG: hypothetical protein WBL06_02095 [Pseudolysinimonas sp.]|uniref:hypothetical protein n=1 Tax=Pseudolysinimonas sp. TaxID=2680009 RepID=UPI003C78E95C
MRVRHFGNTANNAVHNVLLLDHFQGIESELPIRMYGIDHAISAPAWELADFDVPDAEWVAKPDWTLFPEAAAVNAAYSDLPNVSLPAAGDAPSHAAASPATRLVMAARTRLFGPLRGKAWARPLVEVRDRRALARRPVLAEQAGHVNVVYGSPSLILEQIPKVPSRTVCLEHGTIRWVADGSRAEKAFRDAYRQQVQRSMHLWVTNLDPRTLEVAEDLMPGRWSAFPHPFLPDPRVPFPESSTQRDALLRASRSQFLVLLPASQNWSKEHDKGSMTALRAYVELRRRGVDVGLIAIEWGHQLAESRTYLEQAGVGANVVWLPPLARFPLQRMMANVDVVWDQFGLEVFGALALRAVEQGAPLVSSGLTRIGEQFIGGPVPWRAAGSTDEIVHETTQVLEQIARDGRASVVASTRDRYRAWLFERHPPAVTAALQHDLYAAILDGSFRSGSAATDAWPQWIDAADLKDA